ncbi:MAG TPA: ATP-dependent helicase [Thermoanaerobaculaceae bacterium]|nr:ATP-dependent helicase [Thermoanaerobaculaceae bacterium]
MDERLAPRKVALRPRANLARKVDYAAELNAEQREVVMHPGGPMLVLAGAGSGKTRTLVYRVARLIEDGVEPASILLLTFTNRAAREMLERVATLLGRDAGRVMGGTFHSVGNRLLRRFGDKLGYLPSYGILDREDAQDLMGAALTDLQPETPERRFLGAAVLGELYSLVINTGRPLGEVLTSRYPQFAAQQEAVQAVFKRYMERKRAAHVMDYDDLLLNWLLLMRRHPEVRAHLQGRFGHVLVDEYQDTNRLQADIVDTLLGGDRNLLVVGDDAQSIYGFRGADLGNILSFPDRHPACATFRLETNYRSLPPILTLANASIACNQRQFPKQLRAQREGGELPVQCAAPSPEVQAGFVAQRVLELLDEGVSLSEVAVLYRNHTHSLELEVELTRRGIPYEVRSGLRFFEQRHVKDVLAHLRFVTNPRDEVAFARLTRLRPRLGQRLVARVWGAIAAAADPLHAVQHLDPGTLRLPGAAAGSVRQLGALLGRLEKLRGRPGEAVREVLTGGYRDWVRAQLDNAGARLEDLEQLAIFADGYEGMEAFLDEVTLMNELSGEDVAETAGERERLVLSTVHQAKGLEWRVVFVLWLAEGRFPSSRAEDIEEERRLFYVACTRAKDELVLCHPYVARDRYRVDVILEPSRFLAELPADVTQRWEVQTGQPPAELEPGGAYALPEFVDPEVN